MIVPGEIRVAGRRRLRRYTALAVLAFVGLLPISLVTLVRSSWFIAKVRERVLAAIEQATGGRAEVGALGFDWKRFRLEANRFVLHGTEPAGKPPLLRVASIVADLKVISWRRYDVDLQYLNVQSPEIYLVVYPDGRTNLPEPKVKQQSRAPLEGLVNLAIGRFQIENGTFQVESGRKTPFAATGRKLEAQFQYERRAKRYNGNITIQPLEIAWDRQKLPIGINMELALGSNRIEIQSARWSLGSSQIDFSGAVDNLVSPRVSLRYQTSTALSDFRRFFRLPGIERASVNAFGQATYESGAYSVTADWRATGQASLPIKGSTVPVRNLRATGKLRADPRAVNLSAITLAGESTYNGSAIPAAARIAATTIRGSKINVRGFTLDVLGGSIEGDASLEPGNHFNVESQISGFEARRAVALYNAQQTLPWNSLVSGSVGLDGGLRQGNDLRVSANLMLAPAPGGTPVSGHVSAVYDATAETLDLGNSVVNLPSSRVAVSGSLGRQINARLETRNLNDFLPLLGANVQPLPLKLENGSLLFDGTLSGKPQDPHIAGRLTLNQFSVSGEKFDSLASAVNASPTSMRLQDAALARGPLRARFEGALGLRNWEASTASPISARATVRNIGVQEVLARLGQTTVHAAGTLNASAAVSGTVGQPQATGQIEIVKGSFDTEPFDRLTANLSYESRKLEATSGQINAGAKQVRFNVAFDHPAGNLQNGSMRFDIQSNSLPLAQLATLNKLRPGIEGTAQLTAKGALAVASSGVRITALNGDLTARGLQLPNTPLRDVHMTAQTEASPNQTPILRTRFDSGFATSTLHGEGELRLEGDYPGSANIKFSRLDLADLQHWLAPSNQSSPLKGFAEGEIRISGPARMPGQMRGELRVASFELGPASSQVFTLRNEGPIVATAANSVVTIESARLRGSATDVTIGGRVLLNQKNPFDLRANGKLDLGLLHTLDAGFTSSGTATLEAALRGSLSAPQVDGRVQIENASVSHADFPNGIANARGLILFAGDRATIQNLTGETGGGQIRLSGFGGFAAGRPVFGLEVETKGVRIRYPEGISTVSNASLNFNGSGDRSMLTGTVSVLRSNLNLQSDLSSIMAKSAEPVRAPAANTGFFGGLNFDVQVQTAPDAQIESSLTQGVQAEANLRLRGTANNPALQGRINIYQGQAVFFGTKYSISQGSVSFYNPVAIEPVLDVDLATKARGIDITLTVAGPLDKLTVTPRSDPPLQFDEIVSVLATGSYPADTSLRVQQSAIPSAGQQSTSSALLGQVLATPVTGRLQRFFGVSGIRIDPTLPGTEYNPQARVTIQQQVTPDVTFTYIANVTQANPQVVSVEWAASKQWSVVAQREENGLIGLDFFFKKRFK